MSISEALGQSLEVIATNRARSFLTMLGITFGVGCLIAVGLVGAAFTRSIGTEMGRYGSTLLWVQPNWSAYGEGEAQSYLTGRDAAYLTTALPGLTGSSTMFQATETVGYRGESVEAPLIGVWPDHFSMFSIKVEKGRRILPLDLELHRPVCVLRPDIATRLFHDEDPLNKSIRVGERSYTVVGVTERLEQGFLSDGSDNNSIFVPYEHAASRFWGGETGYWIIIMSFDSIAHVELAINRISAYLDNTYGRLRGEERFRVERLDSYIGIVKRVLAIVSTLVLVIAAISLVVGGLGIMNIMLVTVTERTREIGVRMAVGASRRDVLSQFVVEAITLCLLGGGAGVLFGIGIAAIACAALKWRLMITFLVVAGALGASTAIGLVFGIYPAWRASKLQPVEALRSET